VPADTRPPRAAPAFPLIAWSGGLLFVCALAWFVYSYLVRFGRPAAPGPALPAVALDVALFSVFALHHSLLARTRAKRWVVRHVPAELERSLYTWLASALFIVVCTWWRPVPGILFTLEMPWAAAGYALQSAGIALTAAGSAAVDALDLAGIRGVGSTRGGMAARPPALETRGVYALVRHPLYLGWVLFVFGAPHMTATRFVFAVVSTAYLALAIPWEERSLLRVYGAEYEAYRRRVRWRMLPGVY
jgi:methanethiol S-methyltransferase